MNIIFGMEVVFMAVFEKIILYMPGKFWYGKLLAISGQNFAISEFSRQIECDFLKDDHKNNFDTKNYEDS